MLLDKFALPVSDIEVTNVIEHLKQENNDHVDSFYERVCYSDLLNFVYLCQQLSTVLSIQPRVQRTS